MNTTKSDRYSAPYLTKIDGYPDRSALKAGMAHFANTGPFGETCGTCSHLDRTDRKTGAVRCAMFRRLTGRRGETIENYPACKYFEARPKPPPIVPKDKPKLTTAEADYLRTLNIRAKP